MHVETIFQYRTLLGKCELGFGLEWEDIEAITALESTYASHDDPRRQFRREPASLSVLMRGDRINDRVELIEVAAGGFVVRNAPYVARGEHVEIMIEDGDKSYRFTARGVWLKEDGDDFRIGLELVGMPVCVTRASLSPKQMADVVDSIEVAA